MCNPLRSSQTCLFRIHFQEATCAVTNTYWSKTVHQYKFHAITPLTAALDDIFTVHSYWNSSLKENFQPLIMFYFFYGVNLINMWQFNHFRTSNALVCYWSLNCYTRMQLQALSWHHFYAADGLQDTSNLASLAYFVAFYCSSSSSVSSEQSMHPESELRPWSAKVD